MHRSNIDSLFSLIRENKESPLTLGFLFLYPLPLCSIYMLLVKQGDVTYKGFAFAYLVISILFLLRLVFRKIELQIGLVLSRWKEKKAGVWSSFLDDLFILLCLVLFEIPLYKSFLLTLLIIIYEFLILFKRTSHNK